MAPIRVGFIGLGKDAATGKAGVWGAMVSKSKVSEDHLHAT